MTMSKNLALANWALLDMTSCEVLLCNTENKDTVIFRLALRNTC